MDPSTSLRPHPRLWYAGELQDRITALPETPFLVTAHARLKREAKRGLGDPSVEYPEPHHNSLLLRARAMQGRVFLLLGRWEQTRDERYREAVLAHIEAMGQWEYWSWITRRLGQKSWDAIFDLSYGENSYTLAAAYDWLYEELTPAQHRRFQEIARDRSLVPFLKSTGDRETSWWFGVPDSNWNTVCAGGAGMLALAFLDDLEEAPEVLKRAEWSVERYFQELTKTDGGWPEGIGYWNYGMAYGVNYLLSWEATLGRKHPLFKIRALRKSLHFPIDFCPRGVPSSFGDSNHWVPQPFHYALARRLNDSTVLPGLEASLRESCLHFGFWDRTTEFLLTYRDPQAVDGEPGKPQRSRHYRGLEWAVLADRLTNPRLYMSIRGGTTEVKHGHLDLMSYQLVFEDEAMVSNLGMEEYLDSTFSERRYEIFEATPAAKNCIMINGVGIQKPASVQLKKIAQDSTFEGFRLEATEAMGQMRDGPVALFCGRLFLLLEGEAFLILDRIQLPQPGRVETRFHTFADVHLQKYGGQLSGERQKLRFGVASNWPASVYGAVDAPTKPGPGANLVRYCLDDLQTDVWMATLFTPGHGSSRVRVKPDGKRFLVDVRWGKGKVVALSVSSRLGRVSF